MKAGGQYVFLLGMAFGGLIPAAQAQFLRSNVYSWQAAPVTKKATSEQRLLLEGETRDFRQVRVHATTVQPRQAPHPAHHHPDEEVIIIKEGELTVTIAGKTKTLGPGSVAFMMPGDEHGFDNKSNVPVTYYVMRYTARTPADTMRGKQAGGSFWVDRKDVAFQPHNKGGVRRMFDRATTMTKRFEMHETTLNEALWSHDPHTHRAAEMLLMVGYDAEVSIAGALYPATTGDLIFLESDVPHALHNQSKGSCTYLAFQFE